MSPETWSLIGAWTLYGLIGFGAAAMVIFAVRKMWHWFAAIGICFAGVIGAEIVSFIVLHKSISTQYGEWLNHDPLWASIALLCFSVSMLCLEFHLLAYAFKRKKK